MVSRGVEWDDPVIGKFHPTFTEIRRTFGMGVAEYAKQQQEAANAQG